MKKTNVTLACALIAPLAFAQTSTTRTEQTTTSTQPTTKTQTTTTTTTAEGTVTTYEPGKTIIVKSESEGPVSFALGTAARVVTKTGKIVKTALTPGRHVRVYYTGTGDTRVVERVEVEE
jgi:hypothetical protein